MFYPQMTGDLPIMALRQKYQWFFSICVTRLRPLGPDWSFFFFWFKNNLQCCTEPTRLWNINVYFKVSSLCISSKMKVSLSSAPQYSPGAPTFSAGSTERSTPSCLSESTARLGRFLLLRPLGSFVYCTLHSVGENQSVALFATVAGLHHDDCLQDLGYKVAMLLLHVSPCGCVTHLVQSCLVTCWPKSQHERTR